MAAGSIIIDLLLRTGTFETDTDRAGKALQKSLKESANAVNELGAKFKEVALAFGIGFGFEAFKELISGSIEAAAHLEELSKKTGIAADTLGGIGFAAKQSGSDLETVTAGLTKFNKTIAEAAAGNKPAQEAFEALGINIRDAGGHIKSTDALFVEAADKFAQYADGANKTALALRLFGKAGADQIALLDQGGRKLQENIDYYKRFSGVTKETTESSHEFEQTLGRVGLISGSLGTTIAAELLVPLQGLATEFLTLKENSTLFATVASGVRTIFIALAESAAYVVLSIGAASTVLDGFVQKAEALHAAQEKAKSFTDPFGSKAVFDPALPKQFSAITQQVNTDLATTRKQFTDLVALLNGGTLATDNYSHEGRNQPAPKKPQAPGLPAAGAADAYNALLKEAKALDAVALASIKATGSEEILTDAQKLAAKTAADYAAGLIKLTPSQLANVNAVLKTADAHEKQVAALKLDADLTKAATDENAAYIDSNEKARDSIDIQVRDLQRLVDAYGGTTREIKELETAKLRQEAANLNTIAQLQEEAGFQDAAARSNRDRANAITNLANLQDKLAVKETDGNIAASKFFKQYSEDANNAAKVTTDFLSSVTGSLETSLESFFTTGKLGFRSLVTTILSEALKLYAIKPLLAEIFGNGTAGSSVFSSLGTAALNYLSGGSSASASSSNGSVPHAATGTNYVTKSGLAVIHEGEAVIPKSYNPAAGAWGNGGNKPNITVHNYVGGDTSTKTDDKGNVELIIQKAADRGEQQSANNLASRRGPHYEAMKALGIPSNGNLARRT